MDRKDLKKINNYTYHLIFYFYLGYGEYFFKDVPLSAEEHFNDLARGEMAKKKVEKPTHDFWEFRIIKEKQKKKIFQ